jgi:hypothetical protein
MKNPNREGLGFRYWWWMGYLLQTVASKKVYDALLGVVTA